MRTYIDLKWPAVFGCLCLGGIFATIALAATMPDAIFGSSSSQGKPMDQVDAVVIVLAALGVILTAIGVIIAIAAIWGYNSIKIAAEERAVSTANEIIETALKEDGILFGHVLTSLGENGALFERVKEEMFAGLTQWNSSGYTDPLEENEEPDR